MLRETAFLSSGRPFLGSPEPRTMAGSTSLQTFQPGTKSRQCFSTAFLAGPFILMAAENSIQKIR